MEKKTIRSGAPFVFAGVGVLAVALTAGIGTISSYLIAAGVGCAAFALGKKKYPDRVVEVETAPKSGNAEVDALIREARGQLDQIAAANDAIADPALSRQIEDIETTCRQILQRLEEQPNMLSQLRTFLRYYLPATLKLLNARAALEAEVNAGGSPQIAARIAKAVGEVAVRLPQAAGRAQRVPLHQSGKRNGRAGGHAQIRRPDRRTGRARRCKRGTAGGRPLRLALRQGGKKING